MHLPKCVVFPLSLWLHSERKFFGRRIINPPHEFKAYVRHRKSTPRSDREVYDVLAALLKRLTHFLQICRQGNHQPAATANPWIARQDPEQRQPPLDPCRSQWTPSLRGGGVRKTKLAAGPLRPLDPVARHPKNAHQSWGASFSGWSMIRYGTVTLRVVPPGWIWSLRLWSRTSLSRWMPCFFFSSDVTNLARDQQVKASHVLPQVH